MHGAEARSMSCNTRVPLLQHKGGVTAAAAQPYGDRRKTCSTAAIHALRRPAKHHQRAVKGRGFHGKRRFFHTKICETWPAIGSRRVIGPKPFHTKTRKIRPVHGKNRKLYRQKTTEILGQPVCFFYFCTRKTNIHLLYGRLSRGEQQYLT